MSEHSFPSSSVAILWDVLRCLRHAFQENLISSVAYSILGERATQKAGKILKCIHRQYMLQVILILVSAQILLLLWLMR